MGTIPYKTAVILDTEDTSGQINLDGLQVGAILFPSGFTGATISFELPDGGAGWAALNGITVTPVLSQWVALPEDEAFVLGDDFRIVSANNEAADRTLKIAPRSV